MKKLTRGRALAGVAALALSLGVFAVPNAGATGGTNTSLLSGLGLGGLLDSLGLGNPVADHCSGVNILLAGVGADCDTFDLTNILNGFALF